MQGGNHAALFSCTRALQLAGRLEVQFPLLQWHLDMNGHVQVWAAGSVMCVLKLCVDTYTHCAARQHSGDSAAPCWLESWVASSCATKAKITSFSDLWREADNGNRHPAWTDGYSRKFHIVHRLKFLLHLCLKQSVGPKKSGYVFCSRRVHRHQAGWPHIVSKSVWPGFKIWLNRMCIRVEKSQIYPHCLVCCQLRFFRFFSFKPPP